jgi:serine protease Do
MRRFSPLSFLVAASASVFGLVVGIVLATGLQMPAPLSAQVGTGYPVSISGESPFVAVAEAVTPAVVNISAEHTEQVEDPRFFDFFDDPFFRRFFGDRPDIPRDTPRMRRSQSLGSGFIFREDGYILTNNHVVSGAEDVQVRLSDERVFAAVVVGRDPDTDLAVVKIDTDEPLPVVPFGNSDALRVGEWVMAVGNPFPQLGLDRTVTVGVVSAVGRRGLVFGEETPYLQNYIQTDASINPGNSGGPLVNLRGEVIGINSAITSPSGGNVGIGFAVPVDIAKQIVPQLIESGEVRRGWLGVSIQDVDPDMAEALGLGRARGAMVSSVFEGSPADGAGLVEGDVIISFDGEEVSDYAALQRMVAAHSPGVNITLGYIRDGRERETSLTLGDRTEATGELATAPPPEEPATGEWLGLTVETFTDSTARRLGVSFVQGVLVTAVEPGSPADRKSIRAGDVIVEVDGEGVPDVATFDRMATEHEGSTKAVLFLVNTRGQSRYVAVKPD